MCWLCLILNQTQIQLACLCVQVRRSEIWGGECTDGAPGSLWGNALLQAVNIRRKAGGMETTWEGSAGGQMWKQQCWSVHWVLEMEFQLRGKPASARSYLVLLGVDFVRWVASNGKLLYSGLCKTTCVFTMHMGRHGDTGTRWNTHGRRRGCLQCVNRILINHPSFIFGNFFLIFRFVL